MNSLAFNKLSTILKYIEEKITKDITNLSLQEMLSYYKELVSLNDDSITKGIEILNNVNMLNDQELELMELYRSMSSERQKLLLAKLRKINV